MWFPLTICKQVINSLGKANLNNIQMLRASTYFWPKLGFETYKKDSWNPQNV